MTRRGVPIALPVVILWCIASCSTGRDSTIVVGSKNFTEQVVLGEILAQQLESMTGAQVERRFYLGGTYIAHQALLAGRIFAGLLYGVSATDPLIFAAVTVVLSLAAVLAGWIPARRAARLDPLQALREE